MTRLFKPQRRARSVALSRSLSLSLSLTLGVAGVASAQPMPMEAERQIVIGDGDGAGMIAFAAGEMGTERVVKGAPYCAEAVHETVQWLPDGSGGAPNRIVRQQSTQLCRDGEGRTRQEVQRGSRKVVYLRDPVARESWMLDADRKTARRLPDGRTLHTATSSVTSATINGPGVGANAGAGATAGANAAANAGEADRAAWRAYAERMREWARGMAQRAREGMPGSVSPTPPTPPTLSTPPARPMPPVPPMPVVIHRVEGATPRDAQVNIVRLRSPADAGAAAADGEWATPPAVLWRAQSWAPRGPASQTPLGSKDIDGVRASGERSTWVIEAGKVGNDKPIQILREVWTAPDLMVTLSSRDFDPRSGEVNYRLKNLKRGEPDAALMRVPADFKTSGPRSGTSSGTPSGQAPAPDTAG